ncbi:MAG: hypothetical protein A3E85_05065 [Gammaproteobacteria bacterium RIFCSPHIGHO2_12_FULL_45_12]|nr:MAG: hypothetical protein A3E85_05065 [Gammaproteobacteria bacterium RIFCSPHIGHO2_12_FULL_45_12]
MVALLLLAIVSFWGFYWAVNPIKINSLITPQRLNMAYETIHLKTADNIKLIAWYIPSKIKTNKAIILLHGYPADKGDILPSTAFLHEKYNLLYLDFRYFGQSEGHYSSIGKHEVLDLLSAVNYLHVEKNISHIGVWGFSMGGAVALMGAAQTKLIDSIVVISPYARLDWIADEYFKIPILRYLFAKLLSWWAYYILDIDIHQISPAQSIKIITIPVFLIYSKVDSVVPYRHGNLIEKNMPVNDTSNVKVFDILEHGQIPSSLNHDITQFFDKTL